MVTPSGGNLQYCCEQDEILGVKVSNNKAGCCPSGKDNGYENNGEWWCCNKGQKITERVDGGKVCCPGGDGCPTIPTCKKGFSATKDTDSPNYRCCPTGQNAFAKGGCCKKGKIGLNAPGNGFVCCYPDENPINGVGKPSCCLKTKQISDLAPGSAAGVGQICCKKGQKACNPNGKDWTCCQS